MSNAFVRLTLSTALLLPLWPCHAAPAVRREVQIRPDGDAITFEDGAKDKPWIPPMETAATAGPDSAQPGYIAESLAARPKEPGFFDKFPRWSLVSSELAVARSKAFWGGTAGFVAGVLQVASFMWLRTIMNRQCYQGGSILSQTRELYAEGGLIRFYQGFGWAILTVPLSRFGDTFANVGTLALINGHSIHPLAATFLASFASALWRILIFPIDTAKTMAQVHGNGAALLLCEKVRKGGILVLWSGISVHFATSWVCTYPWWATFNTMDSFWPVPADDTLRILRLGCIGSSAAIVTDVSCNSLRVLKTLRQAHPDARQDYGKMLRFVQSQEGGLVGLAWRGLVARTTVDVLQSALFSIMWKLLEQRFGILQTSGRGAK